MVPRSRSRARRQMQQAVESRNRRADEKLGVRIGVSLGDTRFDDGDYYGEAVVEAARLCARASGGQVIVTDLVFRLGGSRDGHAFEPLGGLELSHHARSPRAGRGPLRGRRGARRPARRAAPLGPHPRRLGPHADRSRTARGHRARGADVGTGRGGRGAAWRRACPVGKSRSAAASSGRSASSCRRLQVTFGPRDTARAMSQRDDMERLRRVYDEWARGEFWSADIYDPEIVSVLGDSLPEPGIYEGLEGMERGFRGG